VIGLAVPVPVIEPGFEVTVYAVIALPFDAGAVKVIVACAFPPTALTPVGTPGKVAGVIVLDGADTGPVPIALVALTVKVYTVPLVKPVTVIGLAAPVAVIAPGDDVTVYEVIALPFAAGAVKVTVAAALPRTALTAVGAPGTAAGVTATEAADAELVPAALVAVTVKVYAVPLVKPVTVIGLAVPVPVIAPGDDVTVYAVIALPPFETGAVKLTVA
jgi:hypothetical protein